MAHQTMRTYGAYLASTTIHVGAIALLFFIAVVTPPKKLETIQVQMVSVAELEAVPDAPPTVTQPEPPAPDPPSPEPPAPEPPAPEPPAPDPPAPEPPAPEPPAPEPPAPEPPAPEPPKPELPKPELPKPEPPKPVPPKPVPPKPEPPKPVPPKPAVTRQQSIRDRMAKAEKKSSTSAPPRPAVPQPRRSESELAEVFTRGVPRSSTGPATAAANVAGKKEKEQANYAEQVVRPIFYAKWQQPTRGELQLAWPSAVEVTFTVLPDGRVTGWKLTRRSNSEAMNRSVEAMLRQTTRLTPFSQLGITSTSLKIVVNMELGARM